MKLGVGGIVAGPAAGSFEPVHYGWARRWNVGSAILFNNFKTGIALTGTKDGINKVFNIPDSIKLNSETVYWNGQRQIRGSDYIIAGSTITFTASHPALAGGDTLVTDYLV